MYEIEKNKDNSLIFETFKNKLKKQIKFPWKVPDSSLFIQGNGVKLMFVAEIKALFAKYFQKDKSQFSHFTNYLFCFFVTDYPIFWQLLMDIIFGYPLIEQFDTIWQA